MYGIIKMKKSDFLIEKDINRILETNVPINELAGKTVLVTGATGLIGSILIKTMLQYNRRIENKINIIGLVRDINKAIDTFDESDNLTFIVQDIRERINYEDKVDYLIHAASITSSLDFVRIPVEIMDILYAGTKNILEFAKEKECSGVVYLSSLEVYGAKDIECIDTVSEKDYGYLDPLIPRSSYSEGKRMAECLCASYAAQYDLPIKVARLTQTFGAGMEYEDNRVVSQFARTAIKNADIVLHTEGKTTRNYCYTLDAVSGILFVLLNGNKGEAYNIANSMTEISISGLAEYIKELTGNSININYEIADINKYGYNPETRTVLDTSKIEVLGWSPIFDLKEMLQNLIESMKVQQHE